MGSMAALLVFASIATPASNPSCQACAPLVVSDNTIEATAPFASLVFLSSQDKLVRLVFADAHGDFALDGLSPGAYRLDILGLGSLDIEVTPKLGQRVHYGFYHNDGCLIWVADTN